jgi:DNA-binding SARP family transcriptional activator
VCARFERVARAATESGRADEAAEHWERLTRIDPLSSAHAVAYMNALVQRGDRTGALAHGQSHAELVRKELETDPEPEVVRLLARLRAGGAKTRTVRT